MATIYPSTPSPEQFNYTRRGAAVTTTVTSAAAISVVLSVGYLYELTADHDVHYKQGAAVSGTVSQAVASTTDWPLWTKTNRYIWVHNDTDGSADADNSLSFKARAGHAGTVWVAKVIP